MSAEKRNSYTGTALVLLISLVFIVSCTTVDLFEKTATMPKQEWKNSNKPLFDFDIKDTSVAYRLFFTIRHTDKYEYNNIYINLGIKGPGADTTVYQRKDVPLGTNDKGWLGEGMDDIYYHRQEIEGLRFQHAGRYTITLEQIMRDDPLKHVLDAGVRIEKAQ